MFFNQTPPVNPEMLTFLEKNGALVCAIYYRRSKGQTVSIQNLNVTQAQELAGILKKCSQVTKLHLERTDRDSGIGDEGLKALIAALNEGQQKITWLNLAKNNITDSGLSDLATFWGKTPSLVTLVLTDNDSLTENGLVSILGKAPSPKAKKGLMITIKPTMSQQLSEHMELIRKNLIPDSTDLKIAGGVLFVASKVCSVM